MVYIGLGILVISLSFFVYRTSAFQWPLLPSGKWRRRIATEDSKSQTESNEGLKWMRDDDDGPGLRSMKVVVQKILISNEEFKEEKQESFGMASKTLGIPSFALDSEESRNADVTALPTRKDENIKAATKSTTTPRSSKDDKSQITTPSMPPPPRPTSTARRKPQNTLTVPKPTSSTLSPLPPQRSSLRSPPSQASTLRTPQTTSALPPRPSKKILLSPGHSPLDWAQLTTKPPNPTFLRGASIPPHLIRVSPSLLRHHNGRKGRDAWGVWQGKVYNLTPYMDFHPGGRDQLMRGAGKEREGEKLFMEVHPWINWEGMLGECLVGVLVGEGEREESGGLEEMD